MAAPINDFELVEEEVEDEIDTCDCCMRGWGVENEYGLCSCWCSNCGDDYSICRATCYNCNQQ